MGPSLLLGHIVEEREMPVNPLRIGLVGWNPIPTVFLPFTQKIIRQPVT